MEIIEKPSDKVIDYIETLILAGKLKVDDRLPAERDLAQKLNVTRTAVREGIRLLEVMGVVESRQGSGNYIARHFDESLEHVLTILYALDDMSYSQIREFRYAIERQALVLAMPNATTESKAELKRHLDGLLNGKTLEEQTESDRMLHLCLVKMCRNRLVIANYLALNRIIDRFIRATRDKMQHQDKKSFDDLQSVHQQLVEAILAGDLELGKEALDRHFLFIQNDYDT